MRKPLVFSENRTRFVLSASHVPTSSLSLGFQNFEISWQTLPLHKHAKQLLRQRLEDGPYFSRIQVSRRVSLQSDESFAGKQPS